MILYKNVPVIPRAPDAPDKIESEHATSRQPAADTGGGGGAMQPPAAPGVASPEAWQNGRWAVTEAGLESMTRAGPKNETLIEYALPPDQLLRTWPGSAGVSNCALLLAGKSWLVDVEELLDALAHALRVHHPGQTAVDMAATEEAARREWQRTHRASAGAGPLGWEYVPGEATLKAVEERAKEREEGAAPVTDQPEDDDVPDFLEADDDEDEPPPEFDWEVERLRREPPSGS